LALNPIYVDDLVEILVRGTVRGGSYTINVGGPDVVSIADIAKSAGDVLGQVPIFAEVDRGPDGWLVASTDRMRDMFGDVGRTPFLVGLERSIRSMSPH
jgi:nucleoside-diphosphate-sugar epimerase